MWFTLINVAHIFACTIANLLPSHHLHFGIGMQMCANLILHPVNVSTILGAQSPTKSSKNSTVREFKSEIEVVMRSNVVFLLFS